MSEDNWIPWVGGQDSPIPAKTRHEVKFRDGQTVDDTHPETWSWLHYNSDDDIVAYRVLA